MNQSDITHLRLRNQRLSGAALSTPEEVVGWLGAVQAQDYAGAKWALHLRMGSGTGDQTDQALAQGSILRTHLLRPTWHFVTPADIHWLLALTARVSRLAMRPCIASRGWTLPSSSAARLSWGKPWKAATSLRVLSCASPRKCRHCDGRRAAIGVYLDVC